MITLNLPHRERTYLGTPTQADMPSHARLRLLRLPLFHLLPTRLLLISTISLRLSHPFPALYKTGYTLAPGDPGDPADTLKSTARGISSTGPTRIPTQLPSLRVTLSKRYQPAQFPSRIRANIYPLIPS